VTRGYRGAVETIDEHRTHFRMGNNTYTVEISALGGDGVAAAGERVVVSLGAAGPDGEILADGQLEVDRGSLAAVGALLSDALRSAGRRGVGIGPRERPATPGQPWTDELDAELERRWIAGEGVEEIATRLERTSGGIRRRLPRVGCDPEKPGAYLPTPPSRRGG
jgi:hypothetical protein